MELGLLLPVYWGRGPEELGLPGEPPAKGHGYPLRHPLWEEGGRTEGPAHCSGPQALRQSWRVSEAQEGGTGQPPPGTTGHRSESSSLTVSEGHLRRSSEDSGQEGRPGLLHAGLPAAELRQRQGLGAGPRSGSSPRPQGEVGEAAPPECGWAQAVSLPLTRRPQSTRWSVPVMQ